MRRGFKADAERLAASVREGHGKVPPRTSTRPSSPATPALRSAAPTS